MYCLITCKFKKYQINSKQENGKNQFIRHSRAAYSVVSVQIWPKFNLIQALMHVLITCKYKNDQFKNNQETVETPFSPLSVNGGIFRQSGADKSIVSGPNWPKFELLLDIINMSLIPTNLKWIG